MSQETSVTLISAGEDGVAPAVLLTVGAAGFQYLINAPEGFSRVVLEHKVRPSGKLRAIFATGLGQRSMGGLGSLLLRLASDGHGHLDVVGPPGTAACLHGLRHVLSWRHPRVDVIEPFVLFDGRGEHGRCPAAEVYKDENLAVAAVWSHPDNGSTRQQHPFQAWEPPPWLTDQGEEAPAADADGTPSSGAGATAAAGKKAESRSSSSDDSESEESSSEDDGGCQEDEANSSSSSSGEEREANDEGKGGGKEKKADLHDSLDDVFMAAAGTRKEGGGHVRQAVFSCLTAAAKHTEKVQPPNLPARDGDVKADGKASDSGSSSSSSEEEEEEESSAEEEEESSSEEEEEEESSSEDSSDGESRDASSGGGHPALKGPNGEDRSALFNRLDVLFGSQGLQRKEALRELAGASQPGGFPSKPQRPSARPTATQAAPPRPKMNPKAPPTSAALRRLDDQRLLPTDRKDPAAQALQQCDPGGNALFATSSDGTGASGRFHDHEPPPPMMLLVKLLGTSSGLVAVVDCACLGDLYQLSQPRHPAVALLSTQPEGALLGVVHLTRTEILQTEEYRRWMKGLPGLQVLGHRVGANGRGSLEKVSKAPQGEAELTCLAPHHLGLRASARTLARLNTISWRLFPLPPSLKQQQQQTPTSAEDMAAPSTECSQVLLGRPLMRIVRRGTKWLSPDFSACPGERSQVAEGGDPEEAEIEDKDGLSDVGLFQENAMAQRSGLQDALQELRGNPLCCQRDGLSQWQPQAMPPPPRTVVPPSYEYSPWGLQTWSCAPPAPPAKMAPTSNQDAAQRLRQELLQRPKKVARRQQVAGLEAPSTTILNKSSQPAGGTASLADNGDAACAEEFVIPDSLMPLQDGRLSELAFLGTGCAEPSKYRGPSAIHLRLPGGGLMLDAGEGTLGSLIRAHGSLASAVAEVAALAAVWISHKHADHCLGLPGILAARPPSCKPLLVIGPYAVQQWLREVQPKQGFKYIFCHCSEFNNVMHPARPDVLGALGLDGIQSVPVHHCHDAWGVVIKALQGWKIVYSGDTRPSGALQRFGRGATLLIHEATFEGQLQQMAISKRHSTTHEAMETAKKMGAFRTVLTHFSQRYPKLPQDLDLEAADLRERPVVAFDGMRVPLALLPQLPSVMPAVAAALADPDDDGEDVQE